MDIRSLFFTIHFQFVKDNEDFITFHKRTFAPDELFFHNILLNANNEAIRRGITNNNLLYLNWTHKDKGHPDILTTNDFQNTTNTDALFARKFDTTYNAEILDKIDEYRNSELLIAK